MATVRRVMKGLTDDRLDEETEPVQGAELAAGPGVPGTRAAADRAQ